MSGTVPVATSLADIYPSAAVAQQSTRWRALLDKFKGRYGHDAQFVARSPGRVNIIGEHIDYSLYSVLPMAITADCLLAVSYDDPKPASPPGSDTFTIEVANVQDLRFPARSLTIPSSSTIDIDASVHEWSNYFKSGLRGALSTLRRTHGASFRPRSMRVLMDGTVPAGGGLSSSAAFTTASALAVMVAHGETAIDKTALTELAVVSERAVGVNSGGMDQSASVMSERGSALFVSFSPKLSARPVGFPKTDPELCFLIAQSFVTADKFVTGPIHYNLRVVECTLAAAFLNAVANPAAHPLPGDSSPLGESLHGFHETYFSLHPDEQASSEKGSLGKLIELAETTLTSHQGYTRQEIASALGISVGDLEKRYMSQFPVRAERFKLRQRALHVFTEARRVFDFLETLEEASGSTQQGESYNKQLGNLMNETQDSCRDLFECSCPEIDELCRIARAAGSYGSRLTGAGWGGCSVHLVPADKVDSVKRAWNEEYYSKRSMTDEQRETAVVVSRPGSGSAVYDLKNGKL